MRILHHKLSEPVDCSMVFGDKTIDNEGLAFVFRSSKAVFKDVS
jgi:hypothetical protein